MDDCIDRDWEDVGLENRGGPGGCGTVGARADERLVGMFIIRAGGVEELVLYNGGESVVLRERDV